MTVGDLKNLVQNTRHIIAVSASYSVGGMDPAAKAGADTALMTSFPSLVTVSTSPRYSMVSTSKTMLTRMLRFHI